MPGHLPSGQLQQSTSKSPHIRLHIVYRIYDRLGCHPVRRPLLGLAALGLVGDEGHSSIEIFGTPEVAQLQQACVGEEDVGTL